MRVPRKYSGIVYAVLMPGIALCLQSLLWPYIKPFVWFLFFPATFFSARMGGRIGGLIGTLLSAGIVWYFFIPPRYSFAVSNPYNIFSIVVFLIMGYLFSDMQDRLRKANVRLQHALNESIESKEKISELYEKTRELESLKSRFFANVSHELRTPVTLIIGILKKMKSDRSLKIETYSDIDVAERNVRFLLRHVNDLLDLSKFESKMMTAHYAKVDISDRLGIIASQFSTIARVRDIDFDIDISDGLIAYTDIEKLQRIALNLLSNAFKFTPVHGQIGFRLRVKDDLSVELVVWDNGPGIAPENRSRIFDRFVQVENVDTRKHGGTGLGLAIVREFAGLIGGTIELSDTAVCGAKFVLTFPVYHPVGVNGDNEYVELDDDMKRQAIDELDQMSMPEREHVISGDTDSPVVLVVEDNRDMNTFITDAISGKYRVILASDGADGLRKIREFNPDIIITDEMMPEMNGSQMVRSLYETEEGMEIPVIMLTAKSDDALRANMYKIGVREFISKPFDIEELMFRIDNIISERRRTRNMLDESEERYHLLAENVADVIWVFDCTAFLFRYISPSIFQLLGYSPDDVIRMDFHDILTSESQEYARVHVRDRLKMIDEDPLRSYVDEVELMRSDGVAIWTEVTSRFTRNRKTSHIELFGVTRNIDERKQNEARLRDALQERETLLRELYHRTKNNMNVIVGLLALRANYVSNSELGVIIKEIESKIHVMALVHEKLYRSKNLTSIKLNEYIAELMALLMSSYNVSGDRINLFCEMIPAVVSIDIAIPCGLVLNELMINSIKHAFPQGRTGTISIRLEKHGSDGLEIEYADDGIGVSPGFDYRNQRTLGMQTMCMIVEHQLKGTIQFEASSGVRWTIRFKNDTRYEGGIV
ncbi:MAG TPA: ATP-binding protein [Spirochaetota bacterium]